MSENLETRIKELERELALKNAYLSVNFSFPKGNKLPEDVKEEVMAELKKACAQLAEDKETTPLKPNNLTLTDEDVKILKELASTVKSRLTNGTKPSTETPKINSTVRAVFREATPNVPGTQVEKDATVLTLDNVPSLIRKKMGSNEKVFVKSEKNGKAFVVNVNGQGFHIPMEDLEFN